MSGLLDFFSFVGLAPVRRPALLDFVLCLVMGKRPLKCHCAVLKVLVIFTISFFLHATWQSAPFAARGPSTMLQLYQNYDAAPVLLLLKS